MCRQKNNQNLVGGKDLAKEDGEKDGKRYPW